MRFNSPVAPLLIASLTFCAWASGTGCSNGATGTPTPTSTSAATGTGAGGAMATSDLPCDVASVLEANCQSCHGATPTFGAPMPLVTLADLEAPAKTNADKKVYELVGTRTHDDLHPMPQAPNPRLNAADQKVIDDWIAGGAKAGTTDCGSGGAGGGGAGGAAPGSCVPDIHVVSTTKYTVPKDTTDIYICYGVDVTEAKKRHITALLPKVDNAKIVHHIVLFQSDAEAPAAPTECALSGAVDWRMVSVWAPGGKGFELPPEAGFPLEGTTHYIIQVHYNNLQHLTGEADASGFDLCTTDQLRPNDADVMAFGTMKLAIPAQGTLDTTCKFKSPAIAPDLHIMSVMPHMHKLGTAITSFNLPASGGAAVELTNRDPWDFNTQYWTPISTVIKPGDTVATRCAYKNPGAVDVTWGENTADEMCYAFAAYYPKITSAQWKWSLPSVGSKCAPTP
jgi:hypothetical protein